jgi:hypothetical protein
MGLVKKEHEMKNKLTVNKFVTNKWVTISLIALLCVAIFCLVITTFEIFTVGDLPSNFIAAFLEAVITAVITVVLLSGQSSAEEIKERNVKVFEKKSMAFEEYINKLWQVWEDHIISSEEYKDLIADYYRKLMVYLKDPNKSDEINKRLENIGNYIDQKTYGEEYKDLRGNIIDVINILCEEINLGGKINKDKVEALDNKMFPVLFRRELIQQFNTKILENNSDVLKEGLWEEWKEGKHIRTCISFYFKEFSDISIKYCFTDKTRFDFFLIIPHGGKYNSFDEFRGTKTGVTSLRIQPDEKKGWDNLLLPIKGFEDDENINIPFFEFQSDGGLESIANENYPEIINVLAKRAKYYYMETKIQCGGSDKSILEFLRYILEEGKDA